MVVTTPRNVQEKLRNSHFFPRKPSPRPPLPRMQTAQEITTTKSPKTRGKSGTSILEPKLDVAYTSEPDSEASPETVSCHTPTNRSSICTGSHTTSPLTPETLNKTPRSMSATSDSLNRSEHLKSPQSPRKKQFQHEWNNYICGICLALLVMAIAIFGALRSDAMNVSHSIDEKWRIETLRNLERNIDDMREKFKAQHPSIWLYLEAGIAQVITNPRKPTIVLLFSSDDDPMFCLAKMIGNASKTALGSEEDLLLSPEDLGNDYGKVLHGLKDKIEQQKVVIVEHLLDIHPEAMKAFHNLCDREHPLVKEAIYILTMVVDGYQNESLIDFVENQLTLKLRGKVDEEKLQPLITRMTDGTIIHVQPEPGVKSCPLRY